MSDRIRVVALSGGIGGAKLALGLHQILPPETLMVVCNTGDDFTHLGLNISPDVDTMLYTLAGIANRALGWGREAETWTFMKTLEDLGGETWFRLGDGDLALHIERTRRLAAGESLSSIINHFRKRLDIHSDVLPMCEIAVPTIVHTTKGPMSFQHYFVRERCAPVARRFEFQGVSKASPCKSIWEGLYSDALEVVVICPSNPFISIDPILAVPGLRKALRDCDAPVIAISPVVDGRAVKGPTAKMMAELGFEVTATAVADRYQDVIDGFVLHDSDAALSRSISRPCIATDTLMVNDLVKRQLATQVMAFAKQLATGIAR